MSLSVFLISGLLAHQHYVRPARSLTEDGLGGINPQIASPAAHRRFAQSRERGMRRDEVRRRSGREYRRGTLRAHVGDAKELASTVKWRGSLADLNTGAYDRRRPTFPVRHPTQKRAARQGYAPCASLRWTAQHHARTSVDPHREEPCVLRRTGSVRS